MSRRRRMDRSQELERLHARADVEVEPQTGSLGLAGQPVDRRAPRQVPLGTSRQTRVIRLACEIPGCDWATEATGPSACILRLRAHAAVGHDLRYAASVDVRWRCGKSGAFRFEAVDL
ncbi:MAG TPA: hypothetical protein VFE48_22330 [Methylomirabilota bacterium]|nr:hypothetical protein [Methylomirabilota bacterium]